MAYPYQPEHQPPAVPWPADFDDQHATERSHRSSLLTGIIAGVVAVLVMGVGILVGLQLSRPDPTGPATSDPPPTVAAVPTAAPATPSIPTSEVNGSQRTRAQEAARLDRSTYPRVNPRDFALVVKDPDSWAGRKMVIYGVVTQFDAATGRTAFRADTGPMAMTDPADYDQNTMIIAHDASLVRDFVKSDMVTMYVEVQGSESYDTQIGGSTTVPVFQVNIIEPTNLRPSPSSPINPYPAPPNTEASAENQLRSIVANDRPFVAEVLTDQWVPQISSKRPGLVAEGQTWNNALTLGEHQRLRNVDSRVRLIWSGDWSTFSAPNFWVTILGIGYPTPEGALAWCRSAELDRDHCIAKLISTSHGVEGSTAYN